MGSSGVINNADAVVPYRLSTVLGGVDLHTHDHQCASPNERVRPRWGATDRKCRIEMSQRMYQSDVVEADNLDVIQPNSALFVVEVKVC